MRHYEAHISIAASPSAVWAVVVDGASWPSWDSGVDAVEGQIEPGQKITIRSKGAPGRSFPVRVSTYEEPRRLVFSGGMPLGLFRGVRTYTLDDTEPGHTLLRVREEYTGPLLGLIWRSMPDLQPSFDQFVRGLKQRVEDGNGA